MLQGISSFAAPCAGLEGAEGQLVKLSAAGASGEWRGGMAEGSLPPRSPRVPSPASSPNEIPPSQEQEENMGGASSADEAEDNVNSRLLAQPGAPEIGLLFPRTPHTSTRVTPRAGMRTDGEPEPAEDESDEEEEDLSESEGNVCRH